MRTEKTKNKPANTGDSLNSTTMQAGNIRDKQTGIINKQKRTALSTSGSNNQSDKTNNTTKEANDATMVVRARSGEVECLETLMKRYKPLVSGIARGYFLVGGDIDDLIQEGMIGLYNAVTSFDVHSGASFKTFATLCVRRRVQSAIKSAIRLKNLPLNNSLSLNNQGMLILTRSIDSEDDDDEAIYVVSSDQTPEQQLLNKEQLKSVTDEIGLLLSEQEYRVLVYYVKGLSYAQIADKTGATLKAIDNALSRIKSKLAHLA